MSRNGVTDGFWNQTQFPHLNKFKPNCPTDIKERLPNIVFSGPSNLYAHRVRPGSPHEIGIGSASKLRTLDAGYVTRGKSGLFLNSRKDIPGEIGWSHNNFNDLYLKSFSFHVPNSCYIPR